MSDYSLTDSAVRAIGRAEVKRDDTAASIVATMPATFDWTTRGAIAEAIRHAGGWTKESCPARKVGPKGEQSATLFGVGFQALEDAVRALTKTTADPEAGVIRLSLSGEGGATLTLRAGDPGYAAALALIAAQSADES